MQYRIPDSEFAKIVSETNKAIERGYDRAKAEWRTMALQCVYDICLSMPTFTVNDFRAKVRESPIKTHDNRAMGGIMSTARKMGWIDRTGDEIPSRVGHMIPIQIWKSLIYNRRDSQMRTPDQMVAHNQPQLL